VATVDQVLEVERAGWRALSTSGDEAAHFYEEVLAAEAVILLPGGMVLDDRQQIIASMQGVPWDSFELSGERVLPLGRDGAVVAYRVSATRGGQTYEALIGSTYVLDGNQWRLAVHQHTPV
jgi:hypothetical protein